MLQDNAHPAIGTVGNLEAVAEELIEGNCDDSTLAAVVKAIRDHHPYEEPVIDVYTLLDL